MKIEKDIRYNDIGQEMTIKIQLRYEDLEVFEFPESCYNCPCAFSILTNCGRNVPFKKEDYMKRPKTCKLKKVDSAIIEGLL